MKVTARSVVLALMLMTVAMLVVGALAPQPRSGGQTPYLSTLSDLAVRPAQAVPCNNEVCAAAHGHRFQCIGSDVGSHCLLSTDERSCQTILPCPP